MNKILKKTQFSEKVFCLEVEAPLIARSCRPGHFIIVRVDKDSERVPYTIAKSDPLKGTLTLVVQEVGLSSTKLCQLNVGDQVQDIVGPLGNASKIENTAPWFAPGEASALQRSCPSSRHSNRPETVSSRCSPDERRILSSWSMTSKIQ